MGTNGHLGLKIPRDALDVYRRTGQRLRKMTRGLKVDTKIFTASAYQDEAEKNADKERELARLVQVKAEKLCNNLLIEKYHTQLSYLTKEEQIGALAIPKGAILDMLLNRLSRI